MKINPEITKSLSRSIAKMIKGGYTPDPIRILEWAYKSNVPIDLQIKGWFSLTDNSEKAKDFVKALTYLNSARNLFPSEVTIAQRMMELSEKFYATIHEDSSRGELVRFRDAFSQIVTFYQNQKVDLKDGGKLIKRIDSEMSQHPPKNGGPANPEIEKIVGVFQKTSQKKEEIIDGARPNISTSVVVKKKNNDRLVIQLKKRIVQIGEKTVKLPTMEFCLYYVVAEIAMKGKSGISCHEKTFPQKLFDKVLKIQKQVTEKQEVENQKSKSLDVERWRQYVSKINKNIKQSGVDSRTESLFKISSSGHVGSKTYSILALPSQIKIK